MIFKIWKAAALLGNNHVIICTKTSCGSTCPTCGVRWTTFFTNGGKKVIPLYTLKHYFKLPLTSCPCFGRVMKVVCSNYSHKMVGKGRWPFYWLRLVNIESNSHCLLENCEMIYGQSSGVNTSQIIERKNFWQKSHYEYIWQMGYVEPVQRAPF